MGGSGLRSERDMGTGQAPYCCGKPGLQFDTSTASGVSRTLSYVRKYKTWSIIGCLR